MKKIILSLCFIFGIMVCLTAQTKSDQNLDQKVDLAVDEMIKMLETSLANLDSLNEIKLGDKTIEIGERIEKIKPQIESIKNGVNEGLTAVKDLEMEKLEVLISEAKEIATDLAEKATELSKELESKTDRQIKKF